VARGQDEPPVAARLDGTGPDPRTAAGLPTPPLRAFTLRAPGPPIRPAAMGSCRWEASGGDEFGSDGVGSGGGGDPCSPGGFVDEAGGSDGAAELVVLVPAPAAAFDARRSWTSRQQPTGLSDPVCVSGRDGGGQLAAWIRSPSGPSKCGPTTPTSCSVNRVSTPPNCTAAPPAARRSSTWRCGNRPPRSATPSPSRSSRPASASTRTAPSHRPTSSPRSPYAASATGAPAQGRVDGPLPRRADPGAAAMESPGGAQHSR